MYVEERSGRSEHTGESGGKGDERLEAPPAVGARDRARTRPSGEDRKSTKDFRFCLKTELTHQPKY